MWGGDLHLQIIEIIFLKVSAKCSFFVLFFLIMPLNWKGGGHFFYLFRIRFFFFDDLHLQIIASIFFIDNLHLEIIANISPKPSVENSSAQWAIFSTCNCSMKYSILKTL